MRARSLSVQGVALAHEPIAGWSMARRILRLVNVVEVSPLLHGETAAAIDACARSRPRIRWPDLSLYTTAEPCPMCAAAIAWTGIGEVIIGSDITALAGLGISQIDLACAEVLGKAPFYSGRLVIGVLAGDTGEMYAEWARTLQSRGS